MKIINVMPLGAVKALMLDGETPAKVWDKVRINGALYDAVPVYDLPRCVAVEADKELIGETIEFI